MSDPDLDLADAALDTALVMLQWKARALKYEQALREIDKIGYSKRGGQAGAMQRIARAALDKQEEK